jgi:hypothetical protein
MEGLSRTAHRCISLSLVLLGTACAHGEPFMADDFLTQVPFADTDPTRLTLSDFPDLDPVWLPDGSGILYSFTHTDSPEHDRCLGILPRTGGQRVRELCRRSLGDRDTLDVLDLPAVSPGGRLAYRRSAATLFGGLPEHTELVAGTLDDPFGGPVLRGLPFTGSDGRFYVDLSQPQWVDESGLVFIARVQEIVFPCPGCDPEVILRDAGIAHLLADGSGTVSLLPGTETATSVATGGDGVILFTRPDDTRIFRRALDTGAESVAHDLAPAVPFRLSVAGGRILAQAAGSVHLIDPEAGTVTEVTSSALANPVLHPDGTLVVGLMFDPDTFDSDLWRLTLP